MLALLDAEKSLLLSTQPFRQGIRNTELGISISRYAGFRMLTRDKKKDGADSGVVRRESGR